MSSEDGQQETPTIEKIAVIGAGQMGGGIIQVLALAGYDVVLLDINQEQIDQALDRVSVLTEAADHARMIREQHPELGLFVDLDPGYHRTGAPLSDSVRVTEAIAESSEALRGLHFYDGHLVPGDRAAREQDCAAIYTEFADFARSLDRPELESQHSG